MKTVLLLFAFLFSVLAHAEMRKVKCMPNTTALPVNSDQMSNGLIMKISSKCGEKKICIIPRVCTFVDGDVLDKYGSVGKIPQDIYMKNQKTSYGTFATCYPKDDGHCPDVDECTKQNTPDLEAALDSQTTEVAHDDISRDNPPPRSSRRGEPPQNPGRNPQGPPPTFPPHGIK